MTAAPTHPRRRRVVLALAAVLVIALAGLWLARVPLAERALGLALAQAGLAPERLTVTALGWRGVRIEDVVLHTHGRLAVDAVEATWALRRPGLDRIRLVAPRWDIAAGGGTSDPGAALARLRGRHDWPFAALVVERGVVATATPAGPAEFGIDATLDVEDDGAARGRLDLRVTLGTHTANLRAEDVAMAAAAGDDETRVMVRNARLEAEGGAWRGEGIAATLVLADAPHLTVTARRVEAAELLAPFAAAFNARMEGPAVRFSAGVLAAEGQVKLAADGRHDLGAGSGAAELRVVPLRLAPGALQPKSLAPGLGDLVPPLAGTVGAQARLAWDPQGVKPMVTVSATDLAFAMGVLRVEDVTGALTLNRLQPPASPPGQKVAGRLGIAGGAAEPFTATYRLAADGTLAIAHAELGFAGGRLAIAEASLDARRKRFVGDVALQEIDLAALLALVDVEGLSGSGRIDGHLTLTWNGDRVSLGAGRIAAAGPGVLRYQGEALLKELGAAGDALELARQALDDFHYTDLAVEFVPGEGGAGTARLRLEGANPAVENGQRFVFNVTLDSNFERLAGVVLDALALGRSALGRAAGEHRR